jgi:hypothetical protein
MSTVNLFSAPLPFDEAIASRKVKALLPTKLMSEDLRRIRPNIRAAAQFSAQTSNAKHVQKIKSVLDLILSPHDEAKRIGWGGGMQELRDSLQALKYEPAEGKAGTIEDLGSDARLRLVVETNVKMAQGFGRWAQAQDADLLDSWPAAEFYRAEDREEIRDWPARWKEAGGEFFPGGGDYPEGRMIALKNDKIWERLSAFGLPYEPFDFNSGMSNDRDIDRDEAEALGLIQPNERVNVEDIELAQPKSTVELDEDLREQLLEDLGDNSDGKEYGFVEDEDGNKVLQEI